MVFQTDPVDFNSWHDPSQTFAEKHVSYPRLTATKVQSRDTENNSHLDGKNTIYQQCLLNPSWKSYDKPSQAKLSKEKNALPQLKG